MRQMRQLYLSKICSLSKNLACRYKVGISSQQINYSVSVLTLIKSFARHTHIHACTPPYVYKAIHTFMHTCMNSYIKTSPPLSRQRRQTGLKSGGSWIRVNKFDFLGNFTKKKSNFLGQISEKFQFLTDDFKKIHLFQSKFPKNFNLFRQFHQI